MSKPKEPTPLEEISILCKMAEQNIVTKDYTRGVKDLQEALRSAYKLENSGTDEYVASFLIVIGQLKVIAEETKSQYLPAITEILDKFDKKRQTFGEAETKEAKAEAIKVECIATADEITPLCFNLLKELKPSNNKLIYAGIALGASAIATATYFIIKRRK